MNRNEYVSPNLKLITFLYQDIITTSPGNPNKPDGGDNDIFDD